MASLDDILSDPAQRARLPAGMRNNNPGNIKYVGQDVPGLIGPSSNTDQGDPQAVFATPQAGMAAMYHLLARKYNGGKTTPNSLIAGDGGWTPGNYAAAANVAKAAGIGPDDDINMNDPEAAAKFMHGLIIQEHGSSGNLYPISMVQEAITGNNAAAASPALPNSAQAGQSGPVTIAAVPSASVLPGGAQIQPAAYTANPSAPAQNPVSSAISKLFTGEQKQQQQNATQLALAKNQIAQIQPVVGTYRDPFNGLEGVTPPAQQQQSASPVTAQQPAANNTIDPFAGLTGGNTPEDARIQQNTALSQLPYGLGTAAAFGAGFGRGVQNTVLGGQQLLGHGMQSIGLGNYGGNWLVNDANAGLERGAQEVAPFQQQSPIATGTGQLAGAVTGALPLGAGVGAGATRLGAAGRSVAAGGLPVIARPTMLGAAGTGALVGGAAGALQTPVDPNSQNYWQDKAWDTGLGAAGGGLLGIGGRAIGQGLSGIAATPQAQYLMQQGVVPTYGQMIGGAAARTEAKLTSVPIAGDAIAGAQQRAVQQFNAAAYDQALAPIGERFEGNISQVGHEGIEQVKNKIQNVYDTVLPQMQFAADPQFVQEVRAATQLTAALPPIQQQQFQTIVGNQLGKLNPNGTMDGETLKGAQSELTRIASGYLKDPSFDNRQLGDAIMQVRQSLMTGAERSSPPDTAQQLQAADAAWAQFSRLRAAASSIGAMNREGVFTPANLQSAVRAGSNSVGKGDVATGSALMQDLSGAGQSVLGNTYPNSGTPGRLGLMALGGAAVGSGGVSALPALATGGLAHLAYSPTGQRIVNNLLFSRPQMMQQLGQNVTGLSRIGAPGTLATMLGPRTPQE